MPRVGSSKAELSHGSSKFKFEGGPGEVVSCEVVYEFPDNKDIKAACGFLVGIQPLNPTTMQATELDVVQELLKWGAPEKFHVGQCEASESSDYEEFDPGEKPEAVGNCVISVTGSGPDSKSGMAKFSESLEDLAFQAKYLNGFAPNLVGMKADFFQKPNKESTLKRKDGSDPTNLTVKKIFVFPYETGQTAPKTTATKAAAPAASKAKVNGAPAPAQAAPAPVAASGEADDDAVAATMGVLTAIGEAAPGKALTIKQLAGFAAVQFSKQRIPAPSQRAINALIKDAGWMAENAGPESALGWGIGADGASFVLPAAS